MINCDDLKVNIFKNVTDIIFFLIIIFISISLVYEIKYIIILIL